MSFLLLGQVPSEGLSPCIFVVFKSFIDLTAQSLSCGTRDLVP